MVHMLHHHHHHHHFALVVEAPRQLVQSEDENHEERSLTLVLILALFRSTLVRAQVNPRPFNGLSLSLNCLVVAIIRREHRVSV
jgi:hypothetical protein